MPAIQSEFIQKEKVINEQAVDISIELAPYIHAYLNYIHLLQQGEKNTLLVNVAKRIYVCLNHEIRDYLSNISLNLWFDVSDLILDSDRLRNIQYPLETEQMCLQKIADIEHSAVFEIMEDSFIELLMNAIDETIAKHLSDPLSCQFLDSIQAKLRVIIDDVTKSDCVCVTLLDNGRGFAPDLLDLNTKEKRMDYALNRGSHKNTEIDSPYFGGRGMGLRQLMTKMDEGAHIEPNGEIVSLFEKPSQSNIFLGNQVDEHGRISGSIIALTTEKTPLKVLQNEILNVEDFINEPVGIQEKSCIHKEVFKKIRSSNESPDNITTEFDDEEGATFRPK